MQTPRQVKNWIDVETHFPLLQSANEAYRLYDGLARVASPAEQRPAMEHQKVGLPSPGRNFPKSTA